MTQKKNTSSIASTVASIGTGVVLVRVFSLRQSIFLGSLALRLVSGGA